jgi:hypothetical protein
MFLSFAALLAGILMAPSSVNENWTLEGDHTNLEILQVPNIILKRCYMPQRYYVRKMIISGFTGLFIGFSTLYFLNKFGLV